MRTTIVIFFLIFSSCGRIEKNDPNNLAQRSLEKIEIISFKFGHSLRIPFYKVSIEISKRYNGINLELHSSPKDGFKIGKIPELIHPFLSIQLHLIKS